MNSSNLKLFSFEFLLKIKLLIQVTNCDVIDIPIYMLNKKIEFLRKIQSIKNNIINPFYPYNPYGSPIVNYPNDQWGTYGGYYDKFPNKYIPSFNNMNSYSTSTYPDYQQIISNKVSKRSAKNYDLITNMKDK